MQWRAAHLQRLLEVFHYILSIFNTNGKTDLDREIISKINEEDKFFNSSSKGKPKINKFEMGDLHGV